MSVVEGANSNSITASFTNIPAMVGRAVDMHTTWTEILCVCLIGGPCCSTKPRPQPHWAEHVSLYIREVSLCQTIGLGHSPLSEFPALSRLFDSFRMASFLEVFKGEIPSQCILPALDPLRPADQYFAQMVTQTASFFIR
jgi:hypothetical protein